MRTTRNLIRIASVSALLVAGVFGSKSARAEADTFGLGSGRTGAGSITTANSVVNKYASITATVASAATTVTVDDGTQFAPGDLVLIWQTSAATSPVTLGLVEATRQTAIDITATSTGTFEYARVKSIAANVVTLTNPIASANGYAAGSAQMVTVPEYTTLSVAVGGSIAAAPWDGSKGGIVVVFASGAITNNGAITVNSSGFRGGVLVNDDKTYGCTALDAPVTDGSPVLLPVGNGATFNAAAGGAKKGEGIYPAYFSTSTANPTTAANELTYGYGNASTGAGGGDCHNSGGGGGGHAAVGGNGAGTYQGETDVSGTVNTGDRPVGGSGGSGLTYSPLTQLTFGGGGGAGEENDSVGTAGGNGGGAIIIRGDSLAGTGLITANGATAADSNNDGAGGGGAGGLVVVRVSGDATCGGIQANGGGGGHSATDHGPGAGGSGGVVLLQSATATCAATETAGPKGDDGTDAGRGSDPGSGGSTITPPPGGFIPTPCTVADNQCGGCVVNTDCGSGGTCDTTTNACTLPDGGSLDAGLPDAGAGSDAGSDGGLLADGGSSDGGSPTTDGGSGSDGGFGNDGGFGGDGGNTTGDGGNQNGDNNDDTGDLEGGGCSTSGSSDGQSAAFLGLGLVAALAFMRRKKR